jgi:DNA-binding CsgD family transcriptional regulator
MFSSDAPTAPSRSTDRRTIALCGRSRLLLDLLAIQIDRESDLRCGMIVDLEQLTTATFTGAADVVVCEVQSTDQLRQVEQRFGEATLMLLLPDQIDSALDPSGLLASWPWRVTGSDSLMRFLGVLRDAAGQVPVSETSPAPVLAASPAEQLQGLSRRELDVFKLLAKGNSVKEVARTLGLSFKAVDSQKYRIMRKLGLTDRVQVTRLAIRAGLITP